MSAFDIRRKLERDRIALTLPIPAGPPPAGTLNYPRGTAWEFATGLAQGTDWQNAQLATGLGAFAGFNMYDSKQGGPTLADDIMPGRANLPEPTGSPASIEDGDIIEMETPMLATTNAVTGGTITAAGSGYTSIPALAINTSTGTGATAAALLGVVSASPKSGTAGTGYAVDDLVYVTNTGGAFTQPAVLKVTAIGGGGSISTLAAQTAGLYSALPTTSQSSVTQASTSGSGSGAEFTLSWGITGVNMTAYGSGYSDATFALSGGGGSGAAITAVLAGAITSELALGTNLSFEQGLICVANPGQTYLFRLVDYLAPETAGNTRIFVKRIPT